ncbi:MAG: hypothetical protein IJS04_02240 [Muribaculaceae bacterium]|nr:hypothetical protein [Muribaculaceae bacterium]
MIKLNIYAMQSHGKSIARGEYTEKSSPMVVILKETKAWCKLHQAQMDSKNLPEAPSQFDGFTLREEAAAEVIVSMMEYLQHIGCKDIEKLVRLTVGQ